MTIFMIIKPVKESSSSRITSSVSPGSASPGPASPSPTSGSQRCAFFRTIVFIADIPLSQKLAIRFNFVFTRCTNPVQFQLKSIYHEFPFYAVLLKRCQPVKHLQVTSHTTVATKDSSAHRTAIIAALTATIAAALFLGVVIFIFWRRRRTRARSPGQQNVMRERSADAVAGPDDKGWLDSASGWPGTQSMPTWAPPVAIPLRRASMRRASMSTLLGPGTPATPKTPHYSVRARESSMAGFGFGQDIAWQEAHYEEVCAPSGAGVHSEAGVPVLCPTPPSAATFDTAGGAASAVPLLRSHSTASSVSSVYSAASAPDDATATPPGVEIAQLPEGYGNVDEHQHLDKDWRMAPLP
ncbi:hypothetical protein GGX14DRAFT_562903 [Mycena pura]|uniref:Transmembrane protein n=1 Tax=Mycena pura TaxID=153505 RepID=A0AAD6YE98_9AGAR|nr:hypothetical protein GGX14DRAFT_562903 [Mycena pura]